MTWDDVLQEIDAALQELNRLMNTDPVHGTVYQQRMALMLLRKQEANAAKMRDQSAIAHIIEATYVLVTCDGQETRTACHWNSERRLAFDIHVVGVPGGQREYVELPDGAMIPIDSRLKTEEGIPATTSVP